MRNSVVDLFRRERFQHGGGAIWANADKPIEKLVPKALLCKLKKLLLSWGYGAKEVLFLRRKCN